MLYDPTKFETLTDTPWDGDNVRARIQAIVDDTQATYSPDDFWPADEWDAWKAPLPLMSLYAGAAGVLWALHELGRRGDADVSFDLAAAARRLAEQWHRQPDFLEDADFPIPDPPQSGFLVGGSGVIWVAHLLNPTDELADDLHARVLANKDNKAVEVMWGAPGTLLAARRMHDATGDERWADAWRDAARTLLDRRDEDGLWPTALYGRSYRGLTPPHGLVGNVAALLDGGELLDPATRERLKHDTARILATTAVQENGRANWPHPEGSDLVSEDGETRLQWCKGAPGVVITAPYLDEELFLVGAETVWEAGPHGPDKGPGICHGTAGNGYAFLKAFERTQDERWLDRARRFAVHALEQVERKAAPRYSLFPGDLGVALYAADCLAARTAYPLLDVKAQADS